MIFVAGILGLALVLNIEGATVSDVRPKNEEAYTVASKVPLLGMQIEQASDKEVITTGARFVIRPQKRTITCFQRIPEERELGEVRFEVSLDGLKVERQDIWTAVLTNDAIRLRFELDSTCWVEPATTKLTALPKIKDDGKGGYQVLSFESGPTNQARTKHTLISIFPPRRFDEDGFARMRIASTIGGDFDCLSDASLEKYHRLWGANWLFMIGLSFPGWEKGPCDFTLPSPAEEKELKRAVDKAHSLGMKVMSYADYYPARMDIDKWFAENKPEKFYRWGFDGIYLDGLLNHDDDARMGAYKMLRRLRAKYPDKLIWVHNPGCRDNFSMCYVDGLVLGEHYALETREQAASFSKGMDSRYMSGTIGYMIYESARWNPQVVLANNCRIFRELDVATSEMDGDLPGAGTQALNQANYRVALNDYKPRLDLLALERDLAEKKIEMADYEKKAVEIRKRIADFEQNERERKKKGAVPLGHEVAAITASRRVGQNYYPQLHDPRLAADGSTTSGNYLGEGGALVTIPWMQEKGSPDKARQDYVQIDYGHVVPIGRILYDTTYPMYEQEIWQEAFTILASDDGKAWKTVLEKTGITKAQRFEFNLSLQARYLKLTHITSHFKDYPKWHYAYVTELQAYEK